MAKVTLDKVLEEVKALTPQERQKVRELLDTLSPHVPTQEEEDEFERELLAEGLLSRIPPPITDYTLFQNRKPTKVEGKPVSETLIEERR